MIDFSAQSLTRMKSRGWAGLCSPLEARLRKNLIPDLFTFLAEYCSLGWGSCLPAIDKKLLSTALGVAHIPSPSDLFFFFFFKQNIIIIFWLEWFWTKLDKGYTEQNILCMRGVEKGRQNPVSLFFFFFLFWRPLLSSKPAVKNCLYIKSLTLWISSGAAQSLKVSADYVWHIHNNQSQLIRDLDFVLVCLGFLMLGISLFESESKFAFTNFH